MPPVDDERRKEDRHAQVKFVWYRLIGARTKDGAEVEGIAHSCDLSRGGVGIILPRSLPLGELVFLEISTGKFNLSVVGNVVNSRQQESGQHRIGIQILVMPPNDQILYKSCLERTQRPTGA
jgi:hypothetical protein